MEGGCRTGEMAAVQILRSLGLKKSAAQLEVRISAYQKSLQSLYGVSTTNQ
jgi:monoamine oxidase